MQLEAEHIEIKRFLMQNQELLCGNNVLLKKLHRGVIWAFWFRLSSYLIIVGLSFALYYYFIEP